MLGRVLHPLDRRQQTLLLTAMSFAGSQANDLWQFLPDEDAAALREKAGKLEEIPREKRVTLMVRELKGLMAFRSVKGLDGVEPSWLAAGFKGESPRVIAAVLAYMPSSLSRQIVSRLPENVQRAIPQREALKDVPMELIKLVRSRFDQKFIVMPLERELTDMAFSDVVLLTAKELITLVRSVGADEIACALAESCAASPLRCANGFISDCMAGELIAGAPTAAGAPALCPARAIAASKPDTLPSEKP